jgi:hypothetical protein
MTLLLPADLDDPSPTTHMDELAEVAQEVIPPSPTRPRVSSISPMCRIPC